MLPKSFLNLSLSSFFSVIHFLCSHCPRVVCCLLSELRNTDFLHFGQNPILRDCEGSVERYFFFFCGEDSFFVVTIHSLFLYDSQSNSLSKIEDDGFRGFVNLWSCKCHSWIKYSFEFSGLHIISPILMSLSHFWHLFSNFALR